jgi:hypothetical protein
MGVPNVALAPVNERVEGVHEKAPVAVGHGQAEEGSERKAPGQISSGVGLSERDYAEHELSRLSPGRERT